MKNTQNMTLAFLACMALAAPAFAESKIVDQTEQNRHMNTKDLYNGVKPATTPVAPGAQVTQAPAHVPATATANADADFARGMIVHHQSGIDMAKAELANGKDPEMKKLAQSIVDMQGQEIAKMQLWLDTHK